MGLFVPESGLSGVERGGKRVYLFTNVLESPRLSRPMAGERYRTGWGIEVEYRGLGQTLARRKVLAKTPGPGAMELAADVFTLALLLLYAALAVGANVTRLSVARALRVICWAMERVGHGRSCPAFGEQLPAAMDDEHVRRSSKRARGWPHKKNERPPKPPMLRRLTRHEKSRIHAVLSSHAPQLS